MKIESNATTLMRCFYLLSNNEKKKIALLTVVQMLFGIFDLVGVGIIGLLGALSVSGLESHAPGTTVTKALKTFSLENLKLQEQVTVLAIIATTLLIVKTFGSIFLTKATLKLLSEKSADVSSSLVAKLLRVKLVNISAHSTANIQYALSGGVEVIFVKIVATVAIMITDFSLLIIVISGLLVFDLSTAMATLTLFSAAGLALYRFLSIRAQDLGVMSSQSEIQTNELLHEIISNYREISVKSREYYYLQRFRKIRTSLAQTDSELTFQPLLSKYLIEVTVVLGALLVGALQFALKDATHAIGSLTIFMAASTRLAPAFLRLQQSAVQLRGFVGSAWPTLDLIGELAPVELPLYSDSPLDVNYFDFYPEIVLNKVSFSYADSKKLQVEDVSLELRAGEFVAIVGPTGAGKSTLVDLILGVAKPIQGEIRISGLAPELACARWPGAIGYVPQNVAVVSGTILKNVALGFENASNAESLVEKAIKQSRLTDFTHSLELGTQSQIYENGKNLSGGQRQRLGIARALFTQPKLIVLDEATSALDGQTEEEISQTLNELHGKVTLIVVAHRLSTVRNADQVIYMDQGRVLGKGSFEEVRRQVPNFNSQANLMGL